MPKIPLVSDAELAAETREVIERLPPLNIFRMLANSPPTLKTFVDWGLSLLFQTKFDARLREIAILRVAHVTRSGYEWHQHAAIARRVGVTEEDIAAVRVDGAVTALGDDGNLVCRVADEITRHVRLSDAALAAILDRYGNRQALELILNVSHFNMVSRILESTRVEIEADDVLEKNPLPPMR